jgi:hypothetical protein
MRQLGPTALTPVRDALTEIGHVVAFVGFFVAQVRYSVA